MAAAASESVSASDLATKIPRLTLGVLASRCTDTISPQQNTQCVQCGQPFKEGEQFMLDVYKLPGTSAVVVFGQSFQKAQIVMVHERCLSIHCVRILNSLCEFIKLPLDGSNRLKRTEQQTRDLVYTRFKWAVDWLSWHKQYIVHTPVEICLPSDGFTHCPAVLPSFRFTLPVSENQAGVPFPSKMISTQVLLSFFTLVMEVEVVFKGSEHVLFALQRALTSAAGMGVGRLHSVTVFSHAVQTDVFHANSPQEQRQKLVIKVGPGATLERMICDEFEGATWERLYCCMQKVQCGNVSCQHALGTELAKHMAVAQSQLVSAFDAVGGMEVALPVKTFYLSRTTEGDGQLPSCLINCQPMEAAEQKRLYFMKEDSVRQGEAPLLCFQGRQKPHSFPLPFVVCDLEALEQEMQSRSFEPVALHHLTHLRLPAEKVAVKRD